MNSLHWATPTLGFSGHQNQYDAQQLMENRVTAILNVTQRPDPVWPPGITAMQDPTKDDGLFKSSAWFGKGIGFARREMLRGRVLIHCELGINRSPAMVYAVLRTLGHDPQQAVIMIHRASPQANPFKYQHDAEAALLDLGYIHGPA